MGQFKDKNGKVIVEFSSKETNKEKPYDIGLMLGNHILKKNKEKKKENGGG